MASPDYLTGLLKWLKRPEWAEAFHEVLEDHVGGVCNAVDIEFGDLEDLLGDEAFLVLGACIMEDFFTRFTEDDGRNIVDDYLKRRGWKESITNKRYMQALRDSVMSIYEISDIVPGQSFLARDLIRDLAPVPVFDPEASRDFEPFDHIAARIFELNGRRLMSGGTLRLDPALSTELREKIAAARDKMRGLLRERRTDPVEEIDTAAEQEVFDTVAMTLAPPLISAMWLENRLDDDLFDVDDLPPVNHDGDEVEFHDMLFPLLPGVTMDTVRSRLDATPALHREPGSAFWNWLGPLPAASPDGTPSPVSVDTEFDDGVLLGIARLSETEVGLKTNSAARAATGEALISTTLEGLVGAPTTQVTPWDEAVREYEGDDDDDDFDIDDDDFDIDDDDSIDDDDDDDPIEDEDGTALPNTDIPIEVPPEMVHAMLNNYYRKVLNEPVPMLGNVTPRNAARTLSGRAKVVEWLQQLEARSAVHRNDGDPLGTYDFGWIWRELGLQKPRS